MATDAGSGANKNLVTFKPDGKFYFIFLVSKIFFHPKGGNSWFYLGPRAGNNRGEVHFGLIVRENIPGILMDIKSWSLVWNDKGARKENKMSLWRAVTDPEYEALGDFFVRGDDPPTPSDTMFMKAIHRSFCKEGSFGGQIWKDTGSKARDDGAVWNITNGGYFDRLTAGTFVATPGYQITKRPLFVLDESKLRRS